MNILFITELEPFPPNRGERIRSYNLINSMLEFSEKLILVSGNAPPKEPPYKKVDYRQFPSIYSKNRWINLLFLFKRRNNMVKLAMSIISKERINLVFLDYNFLGNYIRVFKQAGIRVAYGTHNVQSSLNYQMPVKKLKDHLYRGLRFLLERTHEKVYFKSADLLLGVSEEDLDFYHRKVRHRATYLVPNYIDEREYIGFQETGKKEQIIMTGNFVAFQNHAGLKWFLEKVWDEELASRTSLIIAGHGSIQQFDQLHQSGAFVKNVRALGTVENLKGYIAESKAAIIPLLHGSGTRLKCIEAMALKTNIISTSVGAEGIRHKGSILIADHAEEFKAGIMKVLNEEISNEEKAYQVFKEEYSFGSITPKLKSMMLSPAT